MNFFLQRLVGALFFLLLTTASNAAVPSGPYFVGGGAVWSGPEDSRVLGTGPSTCPGFMCLFRVISSVHQSPLFETTSDGVYGYSIAPDIVMVLSGNYQSVDTKYGTNIANGDDRGGFSVSGQMTNTTGYEPVWGGPSVGFASSSNYFRSVTSGSATPKIILYIGPNAQAGTYRFSGFFVQLWAGTGLNASNEYHFNAATIIVKKEKECAVSVSPQHIDFGDINLNEKEITASYQLLASKSQDINITCSDGEPADVTISATTNETSSNTYLLPFKNESNENQAYLRGYFLSNTSECSDNTNGLGYNGSSGKKTITNIGQGTLTVPLTWNVCTSSGSIPKTGALSSSATLHIDW